jgi:VWFA-related protein
MTDFEDTMPTLRPPSPAPTAGRLLVAAWVAVLGALAAAAPQGTSQGTPQSATQKPASDQQQQQPTPTFRTEANFVRVDVYPTAGGRAVQDLAQADFEVSEDGRPQAISTFEHVVIQAGGPQETRSEPRNVQESRDMVANSRARLFVLFLDTYHVSREGAWNVRRSVSRLLERTLGPDDLIAVMTPDMSAGSVTFTRHTGSIDEIMDRWTEWGRRHEEVMHPDPVEARYQSCYPPQPGEGAISAIAQEMIARRREKMTLDALRDLVRFLQGLREERKAILAISEGWALYGRNSSLASMVNGRPPGPPPIGVSPGGGLTMGDGSRNPGGASTRECDSDRLSLAQEEHEREFRDLIDEANRGNSSFYTVDPRGLPVFDTPLGPGTPLPPALDQAILRGRIESLQTLATATDGMAVLNSNDIDKGLKRIVDDLTSYYLLGYYSSNAKADGRFHAISVKVKRPGVAVRARRGYRSPTKEEMEAVERGASTAGKNETTPASRAVSALSKIRTEAFVHTVAGYDWTPSGGAAPTPTLWIATELDSTAPAREEAWRAGADVTIVITGADKTPLGEPRQVTLKRDQRSTLIRIQVTAPLPGDYAIRITAKPVGAPLGSTESLRVVVPKPPAEGLVPGQPVLFRRGPFSGAGWQPTADARYRRQERVRVDVPVLGAFTSSEVQLLDRNGTPLASIPVTAATRDENGQKIVSAEVTLAPLTTGDYLVEVTLKQGDTTQKVLAPFRIVP